MNYPNDPMAEGGIAVFAEKLRTGGLTISGVTRAYPVSYTHLTLTTKA